MEINRIVMGSMRFKDRQSAVEVIRAGIDAGFNYIDCSPMYCRTSETENSEAWIGEALSIGDYRDRVQVSTKCSTGDGGGGLGTSRLESGFGIRTREQFNTMFAASLRRLRVKKLDWYHLWTVHNMEQFNEAFKADGWYAGVLEHQDEWEHLGITTHADSDIIIKFLEKGIFESVTCQFNVLNRTRMAAINYCRDNGIKVFAMNPLAGGLLAGTDELKELALRFLLLHDNVHLLIGFSSVEEIEYAKHIYDTMGDFKMSIDDILQRVDEIVKIDEPHCTACGYCSPCPVRINIGEVLTYYNILTYMGNEEVKKYVCEGRKWYDGIRIDRCTECGICATRCPNGLDVPGLIQKSRKVFGL